MPSPSDKEVLFVAGGIGVAPLYFLAKRIVNDFSNLNMKLFIGARTECLLTCVEKFHDLGCEVETATDDGSAGFHGLVTELFEKHLSGISRNHPPIVYASGPMPMLSAVAELAKKHSFNCWVSTEAKMACGIGACMGCAIKVKAAGSWKYVRCCREGPVFSSAEVVWE
jgi:dihydroorotate dehydrogenase electron transfer subunit